MSIFWLYDTVAQVLQNMFIEANWHTGSLYTIFYNCP